MNQNLPIPFFVLSSLAAGQSPFLDAVEVTISAESPTAVTAADFTGDGLNDVVAGSDKLILLPSLGALGLGAPTILSTETLAIQSMTSGDIDGDGDQDIVVLDAGSGSPELAWYENPGSGATFIRRLLVANAPSSPEIQLADLDRDGDLDFVLYVPATNSIVWFERVPGGASSVAQTVAPYVPSNWRFEDANQDGLVDVIFESRIFASISDVRVGLGVSPGSFAPPQPLFGGLNFLGSARLKDYDGDGDLDGVVTQGTEILFIEATSPLVFGAPTPLQFSGGEGSPLLEFIEDFNGDGLIDIVFRDVIPPFQFERRWIAGLPGGVFSDVRETSPPGVGTEDFQLLSDLTGDGLLDGIARAATGVSVWPNDPGPGTQLFAEKTVTLTSANQSFFDSALVDVDADGDLDIVGLFSDSSALSVFVNDGAGAFSAGDQIDFSGAFGVSVQAHDFDQDGDGDLLLLVAVTGSSDRLVILRNDAGNDFQELQVISAPGTLIIDPQVGDIDGDGDLDISVSAIGSGAPIRLFRNDGPSLSFTQILVNMRIGATLGDVDDDGLPDLVGLNGPLDAVIWRRNLGSWAFGPETTLLDAFEQSYVSLADIDSDGATDILLIQGGLVFAATAVTAGSQYSLLTSLGIDISDPIQRLEPLDLNGDGMNDLVGAPDSSFARAWINPGAGGVAIAAPVFSGISVSGAPSFGDLNGDGDLDAVGVAGTRVWLTENDTSRPIGTNVCGPANPNSSGASARMAAEGSLDLADRDVTLIASDMPVNVTGLFLASRSVGAPQPIVGSNGALCLTGAIGRLNRPMEIQNSGAGGAMHLALDVGSVPQGNGRVPLLPGETWHFQAWFRDEVLSSNLTDAISVTF